MDKDCSKTILRIYSILSWITGICYVLFGLFIMLFNKGLTFGFNGINFSKSTFIIIGAIMLLLGVFVIFVACGLWKLKNWARIAGVVLLCIGLLVAILGLIGMIASNNGFLGPILTIVIDGFFFYFLAFDKSVIAICKK